MEGGREIERENERGRERENGRDDALGVLGQNFPRRLSCYLWVMLSGLWVMLSGPRVML